MAALGGWEDALAFRAYVAGALRPGVATTREEMSRDLFPIVSVTDCKSLYDNVHRVGGPRAPTEKRLLVDLTALRHMVNDEYQRWGRELPGAKTLRWVPTKSQLADIHQGLERRKAVVVEREECEVKAFQQLARRLEEMNLGTDRPESECHVRIFKSQILEADPEPMGPPRPLKRLKVFESA
ncbi:unnamed protein product [Cladocopium goreaui]|uniref:Uncharacterized protein n=1 Tax=Cladocopium goreaui TaxID=2562237 RepID=A0A9P1FKK0_9DINO|nr:unnamed protein product [Cladocopium goreaui]